MWVAVNVSEEISLQYFALKIEATTSVSEDHRDSTFYPENGGDMFFRNSQH
jgi:hypothetical protein